MIRQTQAIALRLLPLTNTSRIVIWLTRDQGKVATSLKGALRPRSFLLGQVDTFYTCELIYHAREGRDLHIVREVSPVNERKSLRRDWKATAAAGWLAESLARICPHEAPARGFFDLLSSALDDLAAGTRPETRLYRFELDLLRQGGVKPRLGHCGACGAPLRPESFVHYNSRSGDLYCVACSPAYACAPVLSPAGRTLLAHWLRVADRAETVLLPEELRLELRALLGIWLGWHFDLHLSARRLALQILDLKLMPAVTATSFAMMETGVKGFWGKGG